MRGQVPLLGGGDGSYVDRGGATEAMLVTLGGVRSLRGDSARSPRPTSACEDPFPPRHSLVPLLGPRTSTPPSQTRTGAQYHR